MEDAATAEISRSQLWQWRATATRLEDGTPLTADRYLTIRREEQERVSSDERTRLGDAADLLDRLVLAPEFMPFLTLPAYSMLD
jgi:malate synthase